MLGNKLIKVDSNARNNSDLSVYCLNNLKSNIESELKSNGDLCLKIWNMLCIGLEDILWKNRMVNIEVKLYSNYDDFRDTELDHTDIQCGALTKMRQYIGVTNVRYCDKISFKDIGIVRQVFTGNPEELCAVLYRQLDTSDIKQHRDVLSLYIPDYLYGSNVDEDGLTSTSRPLNTDESKFTLKGKVGKFTKIYSLDEDL